MIFGRRLGEQPARERSLIQTSHFLFATQHLSLGLRMTASQFEIAYFLFLSSKFALLIHTVNLLSFFVIIRSKTRYIHYVHGHYFRVPIDILHYTGSLV